MNRAIPLTKERLVRTSFGARMGLNLILDKCCWWL